MAEQYISVLFFTVSLLLNCNFGFWRKGYPIFSFGWFFYTLMAIPFMLLLKVNLAVDAPVVLPTLAAALLGQWSGGRYRLRRKLPWDLAP